MIEWADSLDSTNSELMRRARAGELERGHTLVARSQSGGRGRLGRAWTAAPGTALLLSKAELFPADCKLHTLSLALGAAAALALEAAGAAVRLKWPNDLLLEGAKLGGVLIETQSAPAPAQGRWVVAGIGINLSDAPAGASRLDSALPGMGLTALAVRIEAAWSGALDRFSAGGFEPFRQEWLRLHAWQGLRVRASSVEQTLEGRLTGLDENGALLLHSDSSGEPLTIDSLDYSLRLI